MSAVAARLVSQWLRQWTSAGAAQAPLSADSRRIVPGDVFLAYAAAPESGTLVDGRAFIADAIERGAQNLQKKE